MQLGTNPVTFECNRCHRHKVKDSFPSRDRLPDGIEKTCKRCRNELRNKTPSREAISRHLEYLNGKDDRYFRNQRRRLQNMGVTLEWYSDQFLIQDGLCAICKLPERRLNSKTEKPFLLAVDHDHETGKIRGLLCTSCNKGLGLLGDTIQSIETALEYLKGNSN